MWKVILAVTLMPLSLLARTWELQDGSKIEGELASYQNGMVILVKDSGGKAMFSIGKFIASDQAHIREIFPEGDKQPASRTITPQKPKKPTTTAREPQQQQQPAKSGHPGLSKLTVGTVPPNITWRIPSTMELDETRLNSFTGKLLLVQFWASSVPQSLQEMEKVAKLYPQLRAGGMEVIGVNMDTTRSRFESYNKKLGEPWKSYYDPERVTAADWGVTALPTNVLIDQNGTIVAEHIYAEQLLSALAYFTQPRR